MKPCLLRLCGQQLLDDFFGLPRRTIEAQISFDLRGPVGIIVVAFADRICMRNVALGEDLTQILCLGARPIAIAGIQEDTQFDRSAPTSPDRADHSRP